MGKHSKLSLFRRVFWKTWEVTNNKDNDVERFRKQHSAETYASEMNTRSNWTDVDGKNFYDGDQYTVRRRSFKEATDGKS